jgi:hypothetical protein
LTDNYSYTRFRWVEIADLDDLAERLSEAGLGVRTQKMPTSEDDVSPYRNQRTSLHVKADTLNAIISPSRATLSQRVRKPFTSRDMRLREIVLEAFPHTSLSFFPWGFNVEPEFELEKSC